MVCQDSIIVESGEKKVKSDSKYFVRQLGSALVPILSTIMTGMTMGYSAILLPQLSHSRKLSDLNESENYLINNTVSDVELMRQTIGKESWIAASAALTMAPGCLLSGLIMDKIGRKLSFLVINPIAIFGWLIIAFAKTYIHLIVGRLLCGLSVGLLGATSPVYIAEISGPCVRGPLLSTLSLAVAVGITIVHILGTWLDWRLTAYISAGIPAICFVLGIFISKSPNWLLSQNKKKEALAVWIVLRGSQSASEEFQELEQSYNASWRVEESKSSKTQLTRILEDLSGWYRKISSRSFYKPLLIVSVLAFVSQFSGINTVTFYCVQMIQEVSGPKHGYIGTTVLDLVRVTFGLFACWLTKRYSRKLLLLISGLGTCLTLQLLAACLFADFGRPWLPIVLLFAYTGTVAVGLVPLPWLLCAELFDNNSRGLGSGLGAGFAFSCFFAVVKTGPLAFSVLTPAGTFTLYGMVALLGSIFLYGYLPETQDKTLRDIEWNFIAKPAVTVRDRKATTATVS